MKRRPLPRRRERVPCILYFLIVAVCFRTIYPSSARTLATFLYDNCRLKYSCTIHSLQYALLLATVKAELYELGTLYTYVKYYISLTISKLWNDFLVPQLPQPDPIWTQIVNRLLFNEELVASIEDASQQPKVFSASVPRDEQGSDEENTIWYLAGYVPFKSMSMRKRAHKMMPIL